MEAVAWDLRWKIALGLPVDHDGWHPTSLTKFRARLLLHNKERLALENTLRLAGELGMLDGTVEQIIDSTPMLGAAATQDTVRLVRYGVKKLLDAVAPADEQAAGQLDRALEFDYHKPPISLIARGGSRPSASGCSRVWPRTRCVPWRRSGRPKACWATRRSLTPTACWGTWSARTSTSTPTTSRGCTAAPAPGRIISTVDTEMRHGRKSSQTRFDGYKLSATATNTPGAADYRRRCRAGRRAGRSPGQAPHRRPTARSAPQAPVGRHRLRHRPGPRRAGRSRRRRLGAGARTHDRATAGWASATSRIDLAAATVTCPTGHSAAISTDPSGQRRARLLKADL